MSEEACPLFEHWRWMAILRREAKQRAADQAYGSATPEPKSVPQSPSAPVETEPK